MLDEVKEKLSENPDAIIHILEQFGFEKITLRNREIRCAFEQDKNPTAVVIKLHNNEACLVKDYEKNCCYDLINYIVKTKGASFKDVINVVKNELGITDIYNYRKKTGPFCGLYDSISRHDNPNKINIYPEEVLQQYEQVPNILWLREGISLETQKKYQIGYDIESQRITIPIRTQYNEIAAIKARCNYQPEEYEPKYIFLKPGPMSQLLYGFCENYDTLFEGDIKVFESEKSVLMLDSFGYHDGVSLGSNSLSSTQAKLLLTLNPKSVTFLLDNSLPLENTFKNIEMLKSYCKMRDFQIFYFDWTQSLLLTEKAAPVDEGKNIYDEILKNELVKYN